MQKIQSGGLFEVLRGSVIGVKEGFTANSKGGGIINIKAEFGVGADLLPVPPVIRGKGLSFNDLYTVCADNFEVKITQFIASKRATYSNLQMLMFMCVVNGDFCSVTGWQKGTAVNMYVPKQLVTVQSGGIMLKTEFAGMSNARVTEFILRSLARCVNSRADYLRWRTVLGRSV